MVIKDESISVNTVMKKLGERGIGTRHFFYPIHKQPALIKMGVFNSETKEADFRNSNYISEHGFYIPSGVGLKYEEQMYVISQLKSILA